MPLTTRLNDWLSQRREQRRVDEATRTLQDLLAEPATLATPTAALAARVEQAVRDGADLTARVAFPDRQERASPLQIAVQNDSWWLQRALLAPFSGVRPLPEALLHVDSVLAHAAVDGAASPAAVRRDPVDQPVSLFSVVAVRVQEALLLAPGDPTPLNAVLAWLDAGANVQETIDGTTLLQHLARHDASFSHWPAPVLARMGVNATGSQGLGVLHTLWEEDADGDSVDGFQRLVDAGADPYRVDDHGNGPLHHLAQGLAEGTVKPRVIQRLIERMPGLDWLRPNARGETLVSLVQHAARRVPPVVRAQASLHAMAPLVMQAERAELEAALFEARAPRPETGAPVLDEVPLRGLQVDLPDFPNGTPRWRGRP